MRAGTACVAVLVSLVPAIARGQAAGQWTAEVPTQRGSPGTLDLSLRASGIDGDRARFDRYQDIRTRGIGLNLGWLKYGPCWLLDAGARNVGYDDQRFFVRAQTPALRANLMWDQVPLFYGSRRDGFVVTPYAEPSAGTFRLDEATRRAVQDGQAIAWRSTPAQGPSVYVAQADPFNLRARRYTLTMDYTWTATPNLDVRFGVTSTIRKGSMPWGASFGFASAVEVDRPVDERTTDVTAGAEWSNGRALLRGEYRGSYYMDARESFTWDNPGRATDSPTAGAAEGRMSLPPTSYANTVSGVGLIRRLPIHGTLTGNLSLSRLTQNATLMPYTSNTALPAIRLDRPTAEAAARLVSGNLAFNTRPLRDLTFNARYRHDSRHNETPPFRQTADVLFDQTVQAVDVTAEGFDLSRDHVLLDAGYSRLRYTAIHLEYSYDRTHRTLRAFDLSGEHAVRLAVDTVGNRYVTVRGMVDHSKRTAGLDPPAATTVAQQPAAVAFDIASRIRDRGTVFLTVYPAAAVGLSASIAAGKDRYPDQAFGLLDNDNRAYSIGFDIVPREHVTFGASYGYERYASTQASRDASPPPDPTFTDPSRDWQSHQTERVRTVTVSFDALQVVRNTEFRFAFDTNKSDQAFLYSGPRIAQLLAIDQFAQLPGVTDEWRRLTADGRYYFATNLAVGVTYWHDTYRVSDYATPNRADVLGSLLLDYGFRPFSANTVFFRVLFFF